MSSKSSSDSKKSMISIRELIGIVDSSIWVKVAIWLIVSMLTTGLPASVETAIAKLTSESMALGFDQLFAQTAPLIWSIAMVAFACHRGWLDEAGLIPSAGLILFGGWLGHFFQHGAAVESVNWLPTDRYAMLGSVVFAALNLLLAYMLSYGLGAFVASIIVGSALGIGWSRWLLALQLRFSKLINTDQNIKQDRPTRRAA